MGALVKKIEEAFASKRANSVHVPEWGLTLTVFPITLGQLSRINEEVDVFRQAARTIQVRAKNPDGSPMFDDDDFEKLVSHGVDNFGPAVVHRVRRAMAAFDQVPEDVADAKKD